MHLPSGKYYAGCKINKTANSENLMTESGYKTTSKIVKNLILTDGLESFKILKIKHFKTPDLALSYETRFLTKVDAANNCKFLNKHNGGKKFVNKGGYKLKMSTRLKMSKPKSEETIQKQNLEKKTRSKDVYKKMVDTRKSKGTPWISDDQKEKIKEFNQQYWTSENREMQRSRMIEYYKNNPISEETKEKLKNKNVGELNAMFGKQHSESAKEKMRLAWKKRKEKSQNNFTEI
jgi:hypothetical protein